MGQGHTLQQYLITLHSYNVVVDPKTFFNGLVEYFEFWLEKSNGNPWEREIVQIVTIF